MIVDPARNVEFPQLQAVIGSFDEALLAFDLSGAFLFANRAVLGLYGFARAADIRRNINDLDAQFEFFDLQGEPLPAEAYPAARVLRGERFADVELWVERRSDRRRWLGSYSGSQVEDSITMGALLVRDVTERHELEARHRATFEVNPTAMSILRLEDLQFTEVNDSFLKLTGYRRDEVVGKTAQDLKLYALNKKRDEAVRNLRQGEADAVLENELELRTKTGEPRTVLSEGRLIRFHNDAHLIDTYLDITERKRAENELSQAVQAAMSDPSWFVRVVQDKLYEIRSGNRNQPGLDLLSTRERQVLEGLASGKNNEAIARELNLRPQTVRNYVATIYSKLGVNSRAEAIVWARERGLIFPS